MTRILLAGTDGARRQVLVLGAGGGLELKALAEAEPRWNFVGVDPALAMLKLAEQTLGPFNARVQLQQGYIDDAPDGPFDAATCLLTLHFLDADERRRTAQRNPPPPKTRRALCRGPFQFSASRHRARAMAVALCRLCDRLRRRSGPGQQCACRESMQT